MKNKKIFATLLAVILLIGAVTLPNTKIYAKVYVKMNRESLTEYAHKILATGESLDEKYKNMKVSYIPVPQNDSCIVQFQTFSFGIVPSSTYKGFYYSPNGYPCAFQGVNVTLIKDGSGYKWTKDGNTGYTEKITDNWYLYEARF